MVRIPHMNGAYTIYEWCTYHIWIVHARYIDAAHRKCGSSRYHFSESNSAYKGDICCINVAFKGLKGTFGTHSIA